MIYSGDSFFTLTGPEQVGLLVLTLLLSLGCLWLVRRLARPRPWGLRLLLGLFAFWLFVWLSPQVYYGYYLTIFEGLPVQSVIKSPPALGQLAELMTFQGPANMSAHGQGFLGWLMVLTAMLSRQDQSTEP